MTPVTGATFPTAMRRSVPCLGGERQRRTSILLSADAGRARLVSRVPLRPRCRKSGSVLGWRAPDHRLTAGGLGPRGSGPLLKGVGRQPPASSPASEASSRRSRALIRPRAERQLDSRSIATQRRECCSNEDCLVGFRRARWLRPLATCERPHRSAASVQLSRSAAGDPSGRSLASARSRLAVGARRHRRSTVQRQGAANMKIARKKVAHEYSVLLDDMECPVLDPVAKRNHSAHHPDALLL